MLKFEIKTSWQGERKDARFRAEMRVRVEQVMDHLYRKTKYNITRRSTRRSGPSRPGEFPHRDTGNLAAKLSKIVYARMKSKEIRSAIRNTAKYAVHLEHGMNRQFMSRTFREEQAKIMQIMRKRVRL